MLLFVTHVETIASDLQPEQVTVELEAVIGAADCHGRVVNAHEEIDTPPVPMSIALALGNHSSSRLCPSGSRNFKALIPAAGFVFGIVCGRGEIRRTWCFRRCCHAASMSRTTTAKCWNQRSLL